MVRPMTTKNNKKRFSKVENRSNLICNQRNECKLNNIIFCLSANLLLELNVVFAIIHISVLIVNAEH